MQNDRWRQLEYKIGKTGQESCLNHICQVMFDQPVLLPVGWHKVLFHQSVDCKFSRQDSWRPSFCVDLRKYNKFPRNVLEIHIRQLKFATKARHVHGQKKLIQAAWSQPGVQTRPRLHLIGDPASQSCTLAHEFISSDRSSYSDSVLLLVRGKGNFFRFWAFMPIYLVFLFENWMQIDNNWPWGPWWL